MKLYLLIFTLVITLNFVYDTSIAAECNIVGSMYSVGSNCCNGIEEITCDNDGHITKMYIF